ncbi:MAG: class I SAM-dependent DNA methyltransferase [Phycisphaerales bacterium JB063]
MAPPLTQTCSPDLKQAIQSLQVAFPRAGTGLDQDEEWAVVHHENEWKQVRLHDYDELFTIPGLYEKWVYGALACRSPQQVRALLLPALQQAGQDPADLNVLDLGAGNGYVAGILAEIGVEQFVGVDINPNAAIAARRDRPGLYDGFIIDDLTDLSADNTRALDEQDFNCLTCVAALGFGDIPPEVFTAAYNRITPGGWVAFTIKSDFLDPTIDSEFSALIRNMLQTGALELKAQKTFEHRQSSDGHALLYDAFIGTKQQNV